MTDSETRRLTTDFLDGMVVTVSVPSAGGPGSNTGRVIRDVRIQLKVMVM